MSGSASPDRLQEDFFNAVSQGRIEAVRELLDRGADPAFVGVNGLTPLANAVFHNQPEVFDLLMQDRRFVATINDKIVVRNNKAALSLAVLYGGLHMVDALIKAGANINAPDDNGKTPLYLAIEKDNPGMVCRLVEAGANAKDRTEQADAPPLIHAVGVRNEIEIMKILVDQGADVNACDVLGFTVAHHAVMFSYDRSAALEYFVEAGGDLEIKNQGGRTAYDMALLLHDGEAIDKIYWLLKRQNKDVERLPLPRDPTPWDKFI